MNESQVPHTQNRLWYFVATVTVIVLLTLMLLGMAYPVVGRDDSVPGVPNALLLRAVFLASFYSFGRIALSLLRREPLGRLWSPLMGCFLSGILLLSGALFYVNGVLDRSLPQEHSTVACGKYIHRMRGTDFFLITRDWRNPSKMLRLRVDEETYHRVAISPPTAVTVTTTSGFLGFERIVRVQPH